jgi:hypothetical protein
VNADFENLENIDLEKLKDDDHWVVLIEKSTRRLWDNAKTVVSDDTFLMKMLQEIGCLKYFYCEHIRGIYDTVLFRGYRHTGTRKEIVQRFTEALICLGYKP